MNTDDFEQRLPRQPLRPVPGEWREDILAAARSAAARMACGAGVPPALADQISPACGAGVPPAPDARVRPAPAPQPTAPVAPWLGWLRDWLWPHPVAWGALGVGWGLIAVFNTIADGPMLAAVRWPAPSVTLWAARAAGLDDGLETSPTSTPGGPERHFPASLPAAPGSTWIRLYEEQVA